MNQFVPDWNSNMGDAFATLGGEDDGLIELLWCNGHVVMQSQAARKPPRPEKAAAIQEEEAAPWFQYAVEDSLEKDLFSELFGEMPAPADAGGRTCKEECGAVAASKSRLMLPPRPAAVAAPRGKAMFGDVDAAGGGSSEAVMARTAGEGVAATEAGESSMLTIGSSFCGSNQVQTHGRSRGRVVVSDTAGDSPLPPPGSGKPAGAGRGRHDATTVTSRSFAGKTEPPTAGGKRKQRDAMDSGSPSEDAEFESAAMACEPAQKLTTAKRRRAAEVHNLSERRRRDRINEKMKALQELIPQCNKTDKASMLDEAIEYLKSLQLQLQMMWMGSGMAPASVMFPAGVHQYMQRMGAVGMGAPHLASMPRMPPFMAPPPAAVQGSPVSHVPAAAAAVSMVDPYARCLAAVEHLQPPSPMHYMQGMGFYQLGAAKNLQQQIPTPTVVADGSLTAATARTTSPPDNTLHKRYENCSRT